MKGLVIDVRTKEKKVRVLSEKEHKKDMAKVKIIENGVEKNAI